MKILVFIKKKKEKLNTNTLNAHPISFKFKNHLF